MGSMLPYIAPELLASGEGGPACDQYSFGIGALQLAGGRVH